MVLWLKVALGKQSTFQAIRMSFCGSFCYTLREKYHSVFLYYLHVGAGRPKWLPFRLAIKKQLLLKSSTSCGTGCHCQLYGVFRPATFLSVFAQGLHRECLDRSQNGKCAWMISVRTKIKLQAASWQPNSQFLVRTSYYLPSSYRNICFCLIFCKQPKVSWFRVQTRWSI